MLSNMPKRKRDSDIIPARRNFKMEEMFVELRQQYSCVYDVSSRDYCEKG